MTITRKRKSSGPGSIPKPIEEYNLKVKVTGWRFSSEARLTSPQTTSTTADAATTKGRKGGIRSRKKGDGGVNTSTNDTAEKRSLVLPPPIVGLRIDLNELLLDDGGNDGDGDELDTPLSVRMNKRRRIFEEQQQQPDENVDKVDGGEHKGVALAARAEGSKRKTRSAVKRDERVVVEERRTTRRTSAETKQGKSKSKSSGTENDDANVEEAKNNNNTKNNRTRRQTTQQVATGGNTKTKQDRTRSRKATTKKLSSAPQQQQQQQQLRFSMRNFRPDKKIPVYKGTPVVPIEPMQTKRGNGHAEPIPIPEAIRVNSPWNEPTPAPTTLGMTARKGQGGGVGSRLSLLPGPPKRVSFSGFQPPSAFQVFQRVDDDNGDSTPRIGPGGLGGGERSSNGNSAALPNTGTALPRQPVPDPWSARPWDDTSGGNATIPTVLPVTKKRSRFGNEVAVAAAAVAAAVTATDTAMPMVVEEQQVIPPAVGGADGDREQQCDHGNSGTKDEVWATQQELVHPIGFVTEEDNGDEATEMKAVQEEEDEGGEEEAQTTPPSPQPEQQHQSTKKRFVAVTSTTGSVFDLCKSAIHRLRDGTFLCSEGCEEGVVTHVVMGAERRTIKALLGIVNGAVFLDPAWITASLEAGTWVSEEPFISKARFSTAAATARATLAQPGAKQLLDGHSVYITPGSKSSAAMRRLATAMGAVLAGSVDRCTVCVVTPPDHGDGIKRPAGLSKDIPAVKQEWLLRAAETYTVLPQQRYLI